MREILQYQTQEGYFGRDQRPDGWDYWGRQTFGHGRLLGGLVQYYRLTEDESVLAAAKKLGNYFISSINVWTSSHEENP